MKKKFCKDKLDKRGQRIYNKFSQLHLTEEELWDAVRLTWEIEMLSLGYDIEEVDENEISKNK